MSEGILNLIGDSDRKGKKSGAFTRYLCFEIIGKKIDFFLEAWFHRTLTTGGAIDITALIVFLNGATDAPHFVMDLIQASPSSLIILLDLLPRRDLPLHPGYIDAYYAATGVDAHRRDVAERVLQARP
ncbi:hypothetical protein PR202_gb07849 [Eleusine coracana subsp. coracana]|uniref:Uncharacterized protein n=1 Tax=Eleusine coracana subsp. coracana TaxID=191504 RepID=A0AAV5EDN0_ELECO|nr:hypothetical protein PR202_gb07849 [Eleusine coracana subsp. coracana]